jgi:hypothetical protein
VQVLAWKRVEDDAGRSGTSVVTLKAFDKADDKGNKFALCYMRWDAKRGEWWYRFINPPPLLPGEKMPQASDAYWHGSQSYPKAPTDKELAAFLKDVNWTPKLGREVETVNGLKRPVTTKLAGGGFGRDTWATHFDRDPPVELFPELKKEK